MGKQTSIVIIGWIISMILSACGTPTQSDSATDTATPLSVGQLVSVDVQSLLNSPTPTSTSTVTPTATATSFSGIIPTQMPRTPTHPASLSTIVIPTRTPSVNSQFNVTTGEIHTVARGESLTIIANQYSVTVNQLLSANGLIQSQFIVPGQQILIPIPTRTPTAIPTLDPDLRGAYAIAALLTSQPRIPPTQVNGLAFDNFFNLSDDVIEHMRDIYSDGQTIGRNPNAFSRLGDSTIEPPHFFYRFDETDYHLGEYDYLQRTINHYSGSYGYDNVAVIRGLHIWSVFDSMWTPAVCDPGEYLLACEFRLHNPSVLIVRLGTNDLGQTELTREYYEEIVSYSIEQGVIPILGTKADRFDGAANPVNQIIREVAEQYQVPLWDFDRVAETVPTRGLGRDNVHLSFFWAHDWRLPQGFTTGHGLHNLTGLIVLDEILQVLHDD